MSKIKIKNFGPIKSGYEDNDGWIDISKTTVFIGNQGSGKSSIAKLISTFTWIEKALNRGDYKTTEFTNYSRFRKNYCGYHRLENYFFDIDKKDIADIEYIGDSYRMSYQQGNLLIEEIDTKTDYLMPQIMYVPAERNFISTINNFKLLKLSSSPLVEFLNEFDNAKNELNELKSLLKLPINDADIEYDKLNNIVHIKGNDYKVRLTEASSGFQSLVPLYLVSWNLANSIKRQMETSTMNADELKRFKKGIETIWADTNMTDEQRRAAISVLSSKFKKSAFINIVEEPEQNLFPSSQRNILFSLLEFNNMNVGNKLILTTHSPYIINFLSIAIQGYSLKTKIDNSNNNTDLLHRLNSIVPLQSLTMAKDVVVYQLNEENGSINKLPTTYSGLPSDRNFLNAMLAKGNTDFDALLEIEEEL